MCGGEVPSRALMVNLGVVMLGWRAVEVRMSWRWDVRIRFSGGCGGCVAHGQKQRYQAGGGRRQMLLVVESCLKVNVLL
jgi:hypothetical protein